MTSGAGTERADPAEVAEQLRAAFELGEPREHVEDQLPAGCGGVEPLGQRSEPDAAVGERGHGVGEVPHGAPEPVEAPHHEGIPGAEVVEAAGQLGAGVQRPGRLLGEHTRGEGVRNL